MSNMFPKIIYILIQPNWISRYILKKSDIIMIAFLLTIKMTSLSVCTRVTFTQKKEVSHIYTETVGLMAVQAGTL